MININEIDDLNLYRGKDFLISKYINLYQPTVGEISDYDEKSFYSMIYQLTSTPQAMKFQLWDMGIDYTTITPYQLFYSILYKLFSKESTSIIFGDLDFTKFQLIQRKDNNEIILYQTINTIKEIPKTNISYIKKIINKLLKKNDVETIVSEEEIIIDEYTYELIMNYLRKCYFIEKDEKMPANESTKMILIEDARDEYLKNKDKEYHSQLKNLISSMINSEGFKYDYIKVWDMKIYAFMDSVKRISKIKNAELLLQSGYSGYGINLNEINKEQLNWLGELE